MDCSPLDSSVHGILQARILEWFAVSLSRGSSWPWDWTLISCITGGFFITESPGKSTLVVLVCVLVLLQALFCLLIHSTLLVQKTIFFWAWYIGISPCVCTYCVHKQNQFFFCQNQKLAPNGRQQVWKEHCLFTPRRCVSFVTSIFGNWLVTVYISHPQDTGNHKQESCWISLAEPLCSHCTESWGASS